MKIFGGDDKTCTGSKFVEEEVTLDGLRRYGMSRNGNASFRVVFTEDNGNRLIGSTRRDSGVANDIPVFAENIRVAVKWYCTRAGRVIVTYLKLI
jgi:hypothetical protein